MLTDSTVLVESHAGGDHVGVRRDADGTVWLADWSDLAPEDAAGTGLEGLEPDIVFGADWFGAGGMLPPGVRRAEVRAPDGTWHTAVVRDGAWSLIVPCEPWTDDSILAALMPGLQVRLLDAHGKRVSRFTPEIAAGSRRVGLRQRCLQRLFPTGLPVLCPICRRGRWRVGHTEYGNERFFCAKCGHSERSGWVS